MHRMRVHRTCSCTPEANNLTAKPPTAPLSNVFGCQYSACSYIGNSSRCLIMHKNRAHGTNEEAINTDQDVTRFIRTRTPSRYSETISDVSSVTSTQSHKAK